MENYLFTEKEIEERRKIFRKESLENDNSYSKEIIIIRAALKTSNEFNQMDYVYVLKNSLINDLVVKKTINSFNENKESYKNSSNENIIIGAINHAMTMTMGREEDYHVIIALVNKKDVYKSNNAGEYHYDGDKTIKAISIIDVSSDTLEVKESNKLYEIKNLRKREKPQI